MKKSITLFLGFLILLSSVLSGCGGNTKNSQITPSISPDEVKEIKITDVPNIKKINVWCFSSEFKSVINEFKDRHPDFDYKIVVNDLSMSENYQGQLDQGLAAGGVDAPDIYTVEQSYAIRYIKGEASQYAATYQDLGIDVDKLVKEASIPQYSIDLGSNKEGKIVGLGYQSTVGTFIYRRSIAKAVWGTDDPTVVQTKIGPGWNKFLTAAGELKNKGYGICSGPDDIWQAVENSADRGWVVDGKLSIDPKREAFLDIAKTIKKNDYSNNNRSWVDPWYNDMQDKGKKKIFGYFGPAWLLNYVIMEHSGGKKVGEGTYGDWAVCEPPENFFWGGTYVVANKATGAKKAVGEIIQWITLDSSESGLQYLWANDKLGIGKKDTVVSTTVMKNSDGRIDFLGGQNMFDVFIPSTKKVNGKNITKDDETINSYWLDQEHAYVDGKKSRDQAIADFKKEVESNLSIKVK